MLLKPPVKRLFLVHKALFIGQVLFAIIFWLLTQNKKEFEADIFFEKTLQSVVVIITGVCIVGANIFFKKRINTINAAITDVDIKIQQYVTNALIKLTMIECPALLSFFAYYITGNLSFFLLALVIMIYFAIKKPGIDNISYHLGIGREDLMQNESKV